MGPVPPHPAPPDTAEPESLDTKPIPSKPSAPTKTANKPNISNVTAPKPGATINHQDPESKELVQTVAESAPIVPETIQVITEPDPVKTASVPTIQKTVPAITDPDLEMSQPTATVIEPAVPVTEPSLAVLDSALVVTEHTTADTENNTEPEEVVFKSAEAVATVDTTSDINSGNLDITGPQTKVASSEVTEENLDGGFEDTSLPEVEQAPSDKNNSSAMAQTRESIPI